MTKGAPTFAVDGAVPSPAPPDPEVPVKARRRTFTAAYKLAILAELDKAKPGETGAILRREGLYSSSLVEWRRQRARGKLRPKEPARRGPPATVPAADAAEMEKLRRENARLTRQLAKAQLVIDIQKKASQIMEIDLTDSDEQS
jgi:transposase-like protein